MKKIFYLMIWGAAWLMVPGKVIAQATRAELRVSPPTAFLRLKPGSTAIHTITLENTGDRSLTISPQIVDFAPDGETGTPIIQSSLSFPYLETPPEGFGQLRLEAKQTAQLNLRIKVPSDAPTREYPMVVLFNQVVETDSDQPTSLASIGSNLVVLVAKDPFLPEINVAEIQAPLIVDSFRGLEFVPILENKQLAAAAASGSASLSNWRSQVVDQFEFFPTVVLGGSRRHAQALTTSPDGSPQVSSFTTRKFLLGPYVIRIETHYLDPETGKQIPVSQASKLVFALPIWFVILPLICVSLLLTIKKIK